MKQLCKIGKFEKFGYNDSFLAFIIIMFIIKKVIKYGVMQEEFNPKASYYPQFNTSYVSLKFNMMYKKKVNVKWNI